MIAVSVAPKPTPSNPVAASTITKASSAMPVSVALSANVSQYGSIFLPLFVGSVLASLYWRRRWPAVAA